MAERNLKAKNSTITVSLSLSPLRACIVAYYRDPRTRDTHTRYMTFFASMFFIII